jgi:hypothetical protein
MSKDGPSSNNILSKPEHILSFIKHALQNETMQVAAQKQTSKGPMPRSGLTMGDLRIVPEEEQGDDVDLEGDSDDETSDPQGVQLNDEMTITALNLLLSILEGALFHLHTFLSKYLWSLFSKSNTFLAVSSHSRRDPRGCRTPHQSKL